MRQTVIERPRFNGPEAVPEPTLVPEVVLQVALIPVPHRGYDGGGGAAEHPLRVLHIGPDRRHGLPAGARPDAPRAAPATAAQVPRGHGAQQQGGAAQGQLQGIHPALAGRLRGRPEDQVAHGQRLHQRTDGLVAGALAVVSGGEGNTHENTS